MTTSDQENAATDAGLVAAYGTIALVGASAALIALAMAGLRAMFGVAVGAALAAANLWLLARIVRVFLGGGERRASWSALALFKFSALLALVYLLLRTGAVGVLPLVIGYGALPVGIVLSQLRAAPARQKS